MTKRNELCPCGSGKKHKKCYLLLDESCKINLIEEHKKREKHVLKFLSKTSEEITNSVLHEGDDKSGFNSPRIRMLLCFVFVEVMANYWDQYKYGKSRKNSTSFPDWIREFCLNKRNKIFKESESLKYLVKKDLYNLRNSLIHAFAFPEETKIIISSGSMEEAHKNMEERLINKISKEKGDYILLNHKELFNLIFEGFEIMMKEFIKNIKDNSQVHIEGIKKISEELNRRGAESIELLQK